MTTTLEPPSTDIELSRAKRRPAMSDRARQERNLAWKLVAPAFIGMVLVVGYPLVNAVYLSMFRDRITEPGDRKFLFLGNYITILTDPEWWSAIKVSTEVMVITFVVELILGMAIAMVMNKVIIPRKTLRTVVLIPYSIVTVVSAYGWQYAFAPTSGFISNWLHTVTFGAFSSNYDWYGHHSSAMVAIVTSEIWKTTPFMSLLLLAGLAQVPGELEEAAEVDGATWWQRLRRVVLPSMKASIMVALLFRALDSFRIFDNIFIMTRGAQDTTSVGVLAYDQTIDRAEIGLGSAISILLFISVLIIATIFIKFFKTDLSRATGD